MLWLNLAQLGFMWAVPSLVVAATTEEKPCSTHDAQGNYYNLKVLGSSKDYSLKTPGGHDLMLNVCKPLVQDTWGLEGKVSDSRKVAGVIRKDHGDLSIGEVNTTLTVQNGNPRILLQNGSACSKSVGDSLKASTVIEFQCDRSVFGAGQPRLVAQLPMDDDTACAFFIEWKTHHACPTGERGPMGWVAGFLVTIVIFVMIYLVMGTLYNRFVLDLRGFDQIPQFSLSSTKYHVSAGIDWMRDLVQGYNTNSLHSTNNGFRRPTGGATSTNPFSHQAQHANSSPSSDRNAFVRPSSARQGFGNSASTTNPVSHQTQIMADGASAPQPAPTSTVSQSNNTNKPKLTDVQATSQEREFMLGDDEDEDDVADAPRALEATPSGAHTGDTNGKGMDSDGVIRL